MQASDLITLFNDIARIGAIYFLIAPLSRYFLASTKKNGLSSVKSNNVCVARKEVRKYIE